MGWVDKALNWTISKKLSIMIVATILVASSKIEGSEWVDIAAIYIGGQAIVDAVAKLRKNKTNNNNGDGGYFGDK